MYGCFCYRVHRIIVTRHVGTPARLQLGSYSTSEQATREKWIDGKTIYKKTVNFGSLPNSTSKNVPHGISGLQNIIGVFGIGNNGATFLPLPFYHEGVNGIKLTADMTNVTMGSTFNWSGYGSSFVTLYYTKV